MIALSFIASRGEAAGLGEGRVARPMFAPPPPPFTPLGQQASARGMGCRVTAGFRRRGLVEWFRMMMSMVVCVAPASPPADQCRPEKNQQCDPGERTEDDERVAGRLVHFLPTVHDIIEVKINHR